MAAVPARVTIAFSNGEEALLKALKKEANLSMSELVRRAVRFYSENKNVLEAGADKKVKTYLEMLPNGEHLIIDIEHWMLFMQFVQALPADDDFWASCDRIAVDHAEEFKGKYSNPQSVLERLENCNFFRVQKKSDKDVTLVLNSESSRRFVEYTTRQLLSAMGYKTDFKASLGKIRVRFRV